MTSRQTLAAGLIAGLFLAFAPVVSAVPVTAADAVTRDSGSDKGMILLAQGKKRAGKKAAKGMREKHITREATLKSKDQSKVDFEAVDIGGARKTPMGSLINQNKADKNYDFVKIRLRWHPEMINSASSLEAGKGM